jgi:hypothetical protein
VNVDRCVQLEATMSPKGEAMTVIDRRSLVRSIFGGAAIAAAGVALVPAEIVAAPTAPGKDLAGKLDDPVREAEAAVPRRRRRRPRLCWTRRGRRECAWR